jgi:hypothetical protein
MGRPPYIDRFFALAILSGLLVLPRTGRADDTIKTYVVPKEAPAAAAAPAQSSAMPASDIPVNAAPVHWTTPSTWKELSPTSIRIGNFAIAGEDGQKAEAAIFSFPGQVGTEVDNVNRWRGEVKLPPIDANKITSEKVAVDSSDGKLYEIIGPSDGIVVATIPRDGAMWFIKMQGNNDVVKDAEPVFRDFLQSIRFGSAATTPAPATDMTAATTAAPPDTGSSDEPKWTVPSNWREKVSGPMIFKSFAATDDKGRVAGVNISYFPGSVGGIFANVNRWRGQMSLPPVDQDKLGDVTQTIDVAGGQGTQVDFTGKDARTGQPGRLVAVIVPHGDNTWFYKLTGNADVVEGQKAAFLKFVQTVQYP